MFFAALSLSRIATALLSRANRIAGLILGLLVFTGLTSTVARAEPLATPWLNGFHSKARLTAATLLGNGESTALYAGVDIRMDKNWKTYWKIPGDGGGIPPEFNWSRSQNVKAVRVMYPLPKLLKDVDGYSIGYKDSVLFPVSVIPLNPSLPVKLRLNVYYGVCEEICIPAEAALSLDVMPNARAPIDVQRDLLGALSRVPAVAPDGVHVTQYKLQLAGTSPHALVKVRTSTAPKSVHVFAVSRNGDYLPIPKMVGRSDSGVSTFKIDLRHVDTPTNLPGQTFDLVVSADGHGHSIPWTVSAP